MAAPFPPPRAATSVEELRQAQRNNIVMGTVARGPDDPNTVVNYGRVEIDEFITDVDCCNLFLLALVRLQDDSVEDESWAYFKICSIHGRPFGPWEDLDQAAAIAAGQYPVGARAGNPTAGYCTHSSVLFPTWHRPYVAMMEQAIYLKMHDIAAEYARDSDKERYRKAAYRFRMPYFDPFLPRKFLEDTGEWQCGMPQILSSREVMVRKPSAPDMLKPIPSPLYQYNFARTGIFHTTPKYPFTSTGDFSFESLWPPIYGTDGRSIRGRFWNLGKTTPNLCTTRTPDPVTGKSDHRRLQAEWENTMRPASYSLYAGLADQYTTYQTFSNTSFWYDATNPNRRATDVQNLAVMHSLEAFHNTGHEWLGRSYGGRRSNAAGHMYRVPWSSFDPVFWLHHSNIDRILAMWQRLHLPVTRFQQQVSVSTSTEDVNSVQNEQSPLMPFLRQAAPDIRFWTSQDCLDTTTMGYTYRELEMNVESLRQEINVKYLWMESPNPKPPSFWNTGFPVDFGPNQQIAPCLPKRVFIDGVVAFPHPYSRPAHLIRATRSIDPEVSGVEPRLRRTVHAPGADSNDLVPADSWAASINVNSIREWDISVTYEKFGAGLGFTTSFFIGEPSLEGKMTRHSNYAGQIYNFANEVGGGCENCDDQADTNLRVGAMLSLTPVLQRYLASPRLLKPFSIKTLGREEVIPFLKEHLQWRIIDTNGAERQPSEIAQFQVQVVTRIFHPPASATVFGTWEPYEPAVEITHGKPGGKSYDTPP